MDILILEGHVVDLHQEKIFKGKVFIEEGRIKDIVEDDTVESSVFILPGLIDSHIHVESSMLVPSEFARLAVVHGTVATVSDPHEIANVLGIDGVKYMIENGRKVPFKFYFGAPSCVPATPFETSGAVLGPEELEELLAMDEIGYLAEMMNFPGVINGDPEVMTKLEIAKKYGKPIDGHAPGVKGEAAAKYAAAGITTDHECFTVEEALDKIKYGMKIQIREGSAAKNFDALIDLLKDYADHVLFCSDDKHPDDLAEGHINELVKRAVAKGYDPLKVLKNVVLNPVRHYNMQVGTLQKGDPADCIVVDNLKDFNVLQTYVDGVLVAENGKTLIARVKTEQPNKFKARKIKADSLKLKPRSSEMKVIKVYDGELITGTEYVAVDQKQECLASNLSADILKIVVLNRYESDVRPAIGFITGFGLKKGALASSVAHDSHNIVAVGVSDEAIAKAMNLVITHKGGVAVVDGDNEKVLPLPVAGLMSADDGFTVAEQYKALDAMAHELGTTLRAPFMTLSFMALLVIPELKISDKGLFDGTTFQFTDLFVDK